MPEPTPETLDWLRQCAAAPGARWHRALLADVEGQTHPEIEPIPAEGLAWLQQSARVHGATYSQVLLHLLERVEALEQLSRQHGAAQPPAAQPAPPPAPAGGLAERVADAILTAEGDGSTEDWRPEARAAIREVAAWMRENEIGYNAVRWLEQEADEILAIAAELEGVDG